jgi:hypothetical protein
MNRLVAANYNDLFITKTSQKILEALPAAGWSVSIEDDYADLKDYFCSRVEGIAEAFTRMDLIVMAPELEPTDADGVCLHFHFFADPARLWQDKQAYGKFFRKDNCGLLRAACEDIMQRAGVTFGEPGVRVVYRPKNSVCGFGENAAIAPAYWVEISYWIAVTP